MDDLDELEGLARRADATAGEALGISPESSENGGPENSGEPAPMDMATEAAMLVDMAAAMLAGYSERAGAVWTPEVRGRVAAAMVPVMAHYGWGGIDRLPPWVGLAVVAGPPVWQSARIIAAESAQAKRAALADQRRTVEGAQAPAAGAPAQAPAPGAPAQAPGAAVHEQVGLYQ